MNSRDVARLFDILLKIDAGEEVPRLAGTPGAFFRRYAAERDTAIRLALEAGVHIRRDGKLSGAPIEVLTIAPLSRTIPHSVSRTHWGEVERHLVLCPELLTIVVLRIWMASASGREAARSLLAAEEGESVRAMGDFRWSPPGAITTGRADFELAPRGPLANWRSAPYIKATADDLMAPAHPLDLRDVYLGGRPRLAQFRCALLRPLGGGRTLLVGGVHTRPRQLSLVTSTARCEAGGEPVVEDGPILALLARDAWSDAWETLAVAAVDPKGALEHIVSWGQYMRVLDSRFGSDQDLEEVGRRSLEEAGISPPTEAPEVPAVTPSDVPIVNLAVALNRAIRMGGALSRERLGAHDCRYRAPLPWGEP